MALLEIKQIKGLATALAGIPGNTPVPQTATITCNGTDRTYEVPHTWNNPSKLHSAMEFTTGDDLDGMIYQNGAAQDYISFPGDIPTNGYQFTVTTFANKLP